MTSQPPVGPTPAGGQLSSATERSVSILAHLSALIAAVVSAGWLSIVGPLLVWVFYKDRSAIARQAAAGAFNFNLAVWLLIIVGWVCIFTVVLFPVGIIVWVVAGVAALFCHIKGAIRASNGEAYAYPFSIPVLH
ncbi:DUF4870 domain-containing protein [Lapillicoccus sp.]|uniref:DUF4870 domain-containing protein n=1 Tax=Lapillicoccus sp. TaxID=1909287 RepID=UPI0032630A12